MVINLNRDRYIPISAAKHRNNKNRGHNPRLPYQNNESCGRLLARRSWWQHFPTAEDLKCILGSVGADADDDRIELLLSSVKGKDITELIASRKGKVGFRSFRIWVSVFSIKMSGFEAVLFFISLVG
ncbi:60S ACIDIC RIBOSOMAL PROTEIN P2A-LIKE [Salix koriyanagi]|uniref:60S ACIDIC RIBOSOMAL PROTEIN P2A-LIKE n=1 Tax=Salix koriyanagi TaxID=2511006 RepID=A0A9Q0UZM4_9ROSI|nr:60S ACIDIC RIBOSOMAL PROTEIN P2A-LIKE [Salix koriyanagi]